jgi:adenosylcobinamide-phosphate synthase
MFSFGIPGGTEGADPLILLLVGLIIEAYLGDIKSPFKGLSHPVEIIGSFVDLLDRKLNRENRSARVRAIRGFLVVVLVVFLCFVTGWAIAWLTQNHTFGWVLELTLIVVLIAQKSLYTHVLAVSSALSDEAIAYSGLEVARSEVSKIVGRNTHSLDSHAISRAAIESCAESFCDGVIAPAFWYVLFGFPGLLVYKAVNTMDSMIGHKTQKYRAFGMTAARLDDILNLIPARLSGFFIVLAAFFAPTAHPLKALATMLRDAGKHRSMNAGWPEAAMAGALDIALAGPRTYANRVANDPWIGTGTAQTTARDIHRSLYLFVVACLINAVWITALVIVRFDLP